MEGRALVGRVRELAAFDEALRCLRSGERALLLLSGEPGIGKTRLLEELAARVSAAGGTVAWGRTWEVGLTPPFWPFIQLLSALEAPDDRAPLLGNLAERADAAARLARFAEVAAFLERRAAAAPIALFLDDLHAADPSSLQLLEYVLPLLLPRRVLFALATRTSDATPEVSAALGRIQRGALRLPLARLDRGAVEALVGERGDAARVFALSEGNPLFVEELVAALESEGALRLPQLSSVRGVIRERVAGLPHASAGALRAAAVVGRDFRGQVVAEMLGAADLDARLAPVLALRMVAMTAPDRYRFSHALVAEAIADELDPSERARLHLRAAQAATRHAPDDSSAIAHHLLAAGHLAAEAAVLAAERAARKCIAQLAFEDAAELLERALHALLLAAPEDRFRRAALLCARAEALQHATRHALAAELCDEAAALARALMSDPNAAGPPAAAPELLARIALARGLEFRFGRTDPLLVALLCEALAALGDRFPVLEAKLFARLAAAEQPAPDPKEPMARALHAIALAAGLEPRDRMDVMYVACAALVDFYEPVALERIHREVLALAQVHDRSIAAHTRLRLCFTALLRIDRRAFDAAVHAFAAEAHALGLPRFTRQVHMLAAMTALLEGRFADAERAAAECEAISTALGDTGAAWIMAVHRLASAWIRTVPPLAEARALAANYPPGRAAITAWIAAMEGDHATARTALAELGERIPADPDLAAMAGSAVAFAGDAALAARVHDGLQPSAGKIVLAAMVGSAVLDLYDRLLLVLAARSERWELIDEYAARALAVAAQLGSPVWAARVRADHADALDRRARAGDAARAASLRAEARAEAERLGMPGLLARCSPPREPVSETAPATTAPPAPPARAPADRLELERSGALWLVRGFGEQVHVKDSRGMQLLARLVEQPGCELHVLELAAAAPQPDSDAGPLLDAQAHAAYRARLAELRELRDEAEAEGDLARHSRAQAEIEALGSEIERAFGLGGRERKAGAASERARSNVQRRIAHAIDQVRSASARLGEHLAASVHTGTYCSYAPGPGKRG